MFKGMAGGRRAPLLCPPVVVVTAGEMVNEMVNREAKLEKIQSKTRGAGNGTRYTEGGF